MSQVKTEEDDHIDTDERNMSVDDSDADAVMRRMNSVYDNDESAVDVCDKSEARKGEDTTGHNKRRPENIMDKSVEIEIRSGSCSPDPPSELSDRQSADEDVEGEYYEQDDRICQETDTDTIVEEENNNEPAKQSLLAIEKIHQQVESYKQDVESFSDKKDSKDYRYLDEMLTRCQLSLDDIQTYGDLEVRKLRKQTVNYIESLIQSLEDKAQ